VLRAGWKTHKTECKVLAAAAAAAGKGSYILRHTRMISSLYVYTNFTAIRTRNTRVNWFVVYTVVAKEKELVHVLTAVCLCMIIL